MDKPYTNYIISLFARHRVAANLLMASMILIGSVALLRLNIQILPSFTTSVISIAITWPGASAEDIQVSITNPLEQELRNLDYLKQMDSFTRTSTVNIFLEFEQNTDMGTAQDQVRERIDRISDFPDAMEQPIVTKIEPYELIAKLIISGSSDLAEIRPLAYQFERELLDAGIEKINIIGLPQREIAIQIDIQTLVDFQFSLPQLADYIAEYSQDVPAGTIGKHETGRLLRGLEQRRSAAAYRSLPIVDETEGHLLVLNDIATIIEREQEEQPLLFFQGKPAVELRLLRHDTTNSLQVAKTLNQWVAKTQAEVGESLTLHLYDQRWQLIKERITLLLKNGLGGLILIVLVLFLFLNRYVAWWVLIGIPTSFLAALGVLYLYGGSINMVSLFAFIMALGIIVDDTIVVGEQSATNLRHGINPLNAVESAAQKMLAPIIASSLTTICAFLPLFFIRDIIGMIIFTIPLVIICVIIASVIECFLVLPGHLHHSFQKHAHESRGKLQQRVHVSLQLFKRNYFQRLIRFALSHRLLVLSTSFSLFALCIGLVISGYINFSFFPSPEGKSITASIQFTIGTPPEKADDFLHQVEQALHTTNQKISSDPLVTTLVTLKNRLDRNDYLSDTGEHFASMFVELVSPDQRQVRNIEFINQWRDLITLPSYVEHFAISEPQFGPPGEDINIQLSNTDITNLKQAAIELKSYLSSYAGVSNIQDNLPFGQEQMIFELTPTGEAIGMTTSDLGSQLRAAFQGEITQTFYDENEEIEVIVILPDAERYQTHTLDALPIITPDGEVVPLGTLARFNFRPAPDTLIHTDTKLSVHVTADVDSTLANNNKVLNDLAVTVLPQLVDTYAIDYHFEGRAEEQTTTLTDMRYGLILGLALIYIVLAWVFSSYGWPIIILLTIPLGLTGAIIGHLIMGLDLTIMSLFGFFGLSGIVINDSIILLSEYKQLKHAGLATTQAIIKACQLRFRAVFLTSLTTIAGLTPLLFETSLQAQFLIPMAVTITFGLAYATLLILVVIPILLSVYEEIASNKKTICPI